MDWAGLITVTTLLALVFIYKRACGKGTFKKPHEYSAKEAGLSKQGRKDEIIHSRLGDRLPLNQFHRDWQFRILRLKLCGGRDSVPVAPRLILQ